MKINTCLRVAHLSRVVLSTIRGVFRTKIQPDTAQDLTCRLVLPQKLNLANTIMHFFHNSQEEKISHAQNSTFIEVFVLKSLVEDIVVVLETGRAVKVDERHAESG